MARREPTRDRDAGAPGEAAKAKEGAPRARRPHPRPATPERSGAGYEDRAEPREDAVEDGG
jgi:hypothetical protein